MSLSLTEVNKNKWTIRSGHLVSWDSPPHHHHHTQRGPVGCCPTPLNGRGCFPRNIIRGWNPAADGRRTFAAASSGSIGGVLFLNGDGGAFVRPTSKRHAAAPTPGRCDANTRNNRPLSPALTWKRERRSAQLGLPLAHSHSFLVPLRVLDVGGLQVLILNNFFLIMSYFLSYVKGSQLPTATEFGFPLTCLL